MQKEDFNNIKKWRWKFQERRRVLTPWMPKLWLQINWVTSLNFSLLSLLIWDYVHKRERELAEIFDLSPCRSSSASLLVIPNGRISLWKLSTCDRIIDMASHMLPKISKL